MATCVAEYLGQRTDVDDPVIVPYDFSPIPKRPFSHGNICSKSKSRNEPICSVRKSDGTLWINCPNRLCTTKKDQKLSEYQKSILATVARDVFDESVDPNDVCVKREVKLRANDDTTYKANYIMTLRSGRSPFPGSDDALDDYPRDERALEGKPITPEAILSALRDSDGATGPGPAKGAEARGSRRRLAYRRQPSHSWGGFHCEGRNVRFD